MDPLHKKKNPHKILENLALCQVLYVFHSIWRNFFEWYVVEYREVELNQIVFIKTGNSMLVKKEQEC
jgi:hypothetical protein